ncbi:MULTISPECIES: trypco2 family protein [unclassified Streptomyces]|uniref:trypco2 family protein n=1 Tax=unclassified Streptomyces TaxID=2593676 RepID=UPI000CD5701C|nr:trypco2 family protein [Streptomyces sp. SM10]
MIELAHVINDLREELERATGAAEGATLKFELGTIELEVSVALERSGNTGAKVRFWVVESGAEAAVAHTGTQRITLSLKPTIAGSVNPPYVSGNAEAHER